MALLLDSAQIEDVRRALELGFVSGVTTNPALIAKTGRAGLDVLADILDITSGPVFYQVTAEAVQGRAVQARDAAHMSLDRVFVKIPATTENFAMASMLAAEGIQCAITAVSHPAQAFLSVQARAAYTIPYVNRLTRALSDGVAVLRDCAAIVRGTRTRVLAASLKTADEVAASVLAGADDITLPLDLILELGSHPLSQQAVEDFAAAMRAAGMKLG
jgi:transaldolase